MLTFTQLITEDLDPRDISRGWGGLVGRVGGGVVGSTVGLGLGAPAGPVGALLGAGVVGGLGSALGGNIGGKMAKNDSPYTKINKSDWYHRMGILMAPQTDATGSTLHGLAHAIGAFPLPLTTAARFGINIGNNLRSLENAKELGYNNDALGVIGQGVFGGFRGMVTPANLKK